MKQLTDNLLIGKREDGGVNLHVEQENGEGMVISISPEVWVGALIYLNPVTVAEPESEPVDPIPSTDEQAEDEG